MVEGVTTTTVPRTAGPQRADSPPSASLPRVTPRWWADAGGVGAGLSLLVVTALWVGNGGVQQVLGGGADAVSALGRLTGLLSSDLQSLQAALDAAHLA